MCFSILMGGDQIARLDGWKEYERILEYPIYVYPRRDARTERFAGRFTLLEGSKAQPEPETYTLVPGIRSWQAARDYLRKEPYGLTDEEVSTPTLIEQAAERFHLVFTQLKKGKRR